MASLTKSLHTVTAVSRVAAFIVDTNPVAKPGYDAVKRALRVLGYDSDKIAPDDPTLQRCVQASKEGKS
jgi:hypothetical protein